MYLQLCRACIRPFLYVQHGVEVPPAQQLRWRGPLRICGPCEGPHAARTPRGARARRARRARGRARYLLWECSLLPLPPPRRRARRPGRATAHTPSHCLTRRDRRTVAAIPCARRRAFLSLFFGLLRKRRRAAPSQPRGRTAAPHRTVACRGVTTRCLVGAGEGSPRPLLALSSALPAQSKREKKTCGAPHSSVLGVAHQLQGCLGFLAAANHPNICLEHRERPPGVGRPARGQRDAPHCKKGG